MLKIEHLFKNIHLLDEKVYKNDQFSLYEIQPNLYRLYRFKLPIRQSGFELENDKKKLPKGTNKFKLDNNKQRAKSKVWEYAMCNDWTHFCTFTIDGKKFARDDLSAYYKKFGEFLNNYQKNNGVKIDYVLIPELHGDGQNWHMHGLMNFSDVNVLTKFSFDDKRISAEKRNKFKELDRQGYLNFEPYLSKFGFCSFGLVKNQEHVAKYITKYITKSIDVDNNGISINKKLYYNSQGLKTKQLIKKGDIFGDMSTLDASFENDYVLINDLTKEQVTKLKLL